MPLEAPNLDDRRFEDLLRELQLRIPVYTPEWTDFNDSDPGMTLVQLFAWMTETTLYRLNQVPMRTYVKFLQLLGYELRGATPAVAHVTFAPKLGQAPRPVGARTRVAAQPADGGDPVVFETERALDLIAAPLSDVWVFDGAGFLAVTAQNEESGQAGTVDPNIAIARVGTDSRICFTNSDHGPVHLVLDQLVNAHAGAFTRATPDGAARLTDTRIARF
jgi:predicted phage baseplate assembly protein